VTSIGYRVSILMLVGVVVVAVTLYGCTAPQPTALPATASPSATLVATGTPVATPLPAMPPATWTPMATLAPQAYLEAMREAASAMRLAAKALEHSDIVLTRHITDTVPSREVTGLGTTDGRIIRMMHDSLRRYQERRMLTSALTNAVSALGLADTVYRSLTSGEGDPVELLLSIQDAELQLAAAQADLVEELIAQGVPAAEADKLVR
jgi:hypothetical protein